MVRRAHRAGIPTMEMAQFQMQEAHRPYALVQSIQTDPFTGQGIADETTAPFPNDFAIGMHPPDGEGSVIVWRGRPRLEQSGLWPIVAGGHLLVQGFMRSPMIVIMSPTVEALLLSAGCEGRRMGRIGLKNTMVSFMRGILFGMPLGRKFNRNAQAPPPDTQSGQLQRTRGGPRHSVIAADDFGAAVASKQARKNMPHRHFTLVGPGSDAQYITREEVPHRQWMQARTIAGAKTAFKVYGPNLIGAARHCQSGPRQTRSGSGSPPAASTQPHLPQPPAQSGKGRASTAGQEQGQFLGSPAGMLQTPLAQLLTPVCGPSPARMMRRSGTRRQTHLSLGLITPPIPVSGLTTEVKTTTQNSESFCTSRHGLHKFFPPLHRNVIRCWCHNGHSMCHTSDESKLSPM